MTTSLIRSEWRSDLPAAVAAEADEWKGRIHTAVSKAVCTTGQALRAMKPKMPHGCFESWWRDELGLKDRKQVSDLMAASELLEVQQTETPLHQLPPRTLAVLQRSGSCDALGRAVQMLEQGQRVTEAKARQLVKPEAGSADGEMFSRALGIVDDERIKVRRWLEAVIDKKQTKAIKLTEILRADDELAGLDWSERVEQGVATPLEQAHHESVVDTIRAMMELEDYMDLCFRRLVDYVPPKDDAMWQHEALQVVVNLYDSTQSWFNDTLAQLDGHRDPIEAATLWLEHQVQLVGTKQGRTDGPVFAVRELLKPWEEFMAGYRRQMADEILQMLHAEREKDWGE